MFYQDSVLPVKPPPTTGDSHRLGWLGLASFEGFGSRTLHKIAAHVSQDGSAAWHVDRNALERLGCRPATIHSFVEFRAHTNLEALRVTLEQEDITFALFPDDAYPPLLRQIADPPYALFVRGTLVPCNAPCVAIVGTRRNTPYGRRVATWISETLARAGITIVSGLAGGIDTIAHEAALQEGGACIAVLGSGVDRETIYPRCNEKLARRILEAGGAVVSEFPPRTPGLKYHFPLRNRIIAGISRATVVIEAAEKSGSLITAHFALEQGRDVFSVPGPITHAQSHGTNRLLAMGAIPCTSPEDILTHLNTTSLPAPKAPTSSLSEEERRLLEMLDTARHIDELARALKRPIQRINAQLGRLELLGFVALVGPGLYDATH